MIRKCIQGKNYNDKSWIDMQPRTTPHTTPLRAIGCILGVLQGKWPRYMEYALYFYFSKIQSNPYTTRIVFPRYLQNETQYLYREGEIWNVVYVLRIPQVSNTPLVITFYGYHVIIVQIIRMFYRYEFSYESLMPQQDAKYKYTGNQHVARLLSNEIWTKIVSLVMLFKLSNALIVLYIIIATT